MKKENVVGAICASCNSCFKNNCSRGSWSSLEPLSIPLVGSDEACALASMSAKKPEKSVRAVSIDDTWRVCSSCEYCDKGRISLDNYMAHCLDCPCGILRDCIEEGAAEAAVS